MTTVQRTFVLERGISDYQLHENTSLKQVISLYGYGLEDISVYDDTKMEWKRSCDIDSIDSPVVYVKHTIPSISPSPPATWYMVRPVILVYGTITDDSTRMHWSIYTDTRICTIIHKMGLQMNQVYYLYGNTWIQYMPDTCNISLGEIPKLSFDRAIQATSSSSQ